MSKLFLLLIITYFLQSCMQTDTRVFSQTKHFGLYDNYVYETPLLLGQYYLVLDGFNGFKILEIKDENTIERVNEIKYTEKVFPRYNRLSQNKQIAAVVNVISEIQPYLKQILFYDVSDPSNPIYLGQIDDQSDQEQGQIFYLADAQFLPGYNNKYFIVYGAFILNADITTTLLLVNIEDFNNIQIINQFYDLDGGLTSVLSILLLNEKQNYIYSLAQNGMNEENNNNGIYVLKINQEPSINITKIQFWFQGYGVKSLIMSNIKNYLFAYTLNNGGSFEVFDIKTDPENPTIIYSIPIVDQQTPGLYLSEDENYIFINQYIYDVSQLSDGIGPIYLGYFNIGKNNFAPNFAQQYVNGKQVLVVYSFQGYLKIYKIFEENSYAAFDVELSANFQNLTTGLKNTFLNQDGSSFIAHYRGPTEEYLIWMKSDKSKVCKFVSPDGMISYPTFLDDSNIIRVTYIDEENSIYQQKKINFDDGNCPSGSIPSIYQETFNNNNPLFTLRTKGNCHLAFEINLTTFENCIITINSLEDLDISSNILGQLCFPEGLISFQFLHEQEQYDQQFDNISLIIHNHNQIMFESQGQFILVDFEDCTNPQLVKYKNIQKSIHGKFVITQDYKYIIFPLGILGFQIFDISYPDEETYEIVHISYKESYSIIFMEINGNYEQLGVIGENIGYYSIRNIQNPILLQFVDYNYGRKGRQALYTPSPPGSKQITLYTFEDIVKIQYGQIVVINFTSNSYVLAIDNLKPMKVNEKFLRTVNLFAIDNSGQNEEFQITNVGYIDPATNELIDIPAWLTLSFSSFQLQGTPTKEYSNQEILLRITYKFQENFVEKEEESFIKFYVEPTLNVQSRVINGQNHLYFPTTSNFLNVKIIIFEEFRGNNLLFIMKNVGAVSSSYDKVTGELILFGPASEVNNAFSLIRYTFQQEELNPKNILFSIKADDLVNLPVLINLNEKVIDNITYQEQIIQENDGEFYNLSLFKRNQGPQQMEEVIIKFDIKNQIDFPFSVPDDPENDVMSINLYFCEYSRINCIEKPDWIIINDITKSMTGYFPQDILIKDEVLNKKVYLKGVVTDQYDTVEIFMVFQLYTVPTQLNSSIQDVLKDLISKKSIVPHPQTYFEFKLDNSLFNTSLTVSIEGWVNKNNRRYLQENLSSQNLKDLIKNNPNDWQQLSEATQGSWINLNSNTKTFYGTPTISNLGVYQIIMNVSEGYSDSFTTFDIPVTNTPPQVNLQLQDQMKVLPYINEPYQFQFSSNTFIDPDNDQLNYRYEYKSGVALPADFKFDEISRTISGTFKSVTTENPFFLGSILGIIQENTLIQIYVGDGISNEKIVEDLIIEVNTTTIYTLQKIFEFLGPLAGVFGLYRYRPLLYKYMCKKKYVYKKPIQVKLGTTMQIQIFLLEQTKNIFQKIWQGLLQQERNKSQNNSISEQKFIENYIISINDQQVILDDNKITQDINQELEKLDLLSVFKPVIDDQEFKIENELYHRFTVFFKCEIAKLLIQKSEFKYISKLQKKIKKMGMLQQNNELDWYKTFVTQIEVLSIEQQQNYQFPIVQFNMSLLLSKLNKDEHQKQINVIKHMVDLNKYNEFNILRYLLYRKVFGLRFNETFAQYSHGISLDVKASQIHNVLTKELSEVARIEKDKNKSCWNYIDLGPSDLVFLSGSQSKPDWIQIKEQFDVITISGKPHESNQGMIVMTILDSHGIILREFSVDIINAKDNKLLLKSGLGNILMKQQQKQQKAGDQQDDQQQGKSNLLNILGGSIQQVQNENQENIDKEAEKDKDKEKSNEKNKLKQSKFSLFSKPQNKVHNDSENSSIIDNVNSLDNTGKYLKQQKPKFSIQISKPPLEKKVTIEDIKNLDTKNQLIKDSNIIQIEPISEQQSQRTNANILHENSGSSDDIVRSFIEEAMNSPSNNKQQKEKQQQEYQQIKSQDNIQSQQQINKKNTLQNILQDIDDNTSNFNNKKRSYSKQSSELSILTQQNPQLRSLREIKHDTPGFGFRTSKFFFTTYHFFSKNLANWSRKCDRKNLSKLTTSIFQ